MLVDRRVFTVKPGREWEAAEVMRQGIELNSVYTGSYRICVPEIGPYAVVVVEWEYENLQEMRAVWEAWWARPEAAEFTERWYALQEQGGHGEIWQVVAQR